MHIKTKLFAFWVQMTKGEESKIIDGVESQNKRKAREKERKTCVSFYRKINKKNWKINNFLGLF